ncbi:hypothetical protein Q8W37_20225 [Shimia thalassica]|jgi:hypothetical protein|uniref:Uncharacterized protein n=1 Tax=Shimia thalassica TaxID=1715693 RepID=A0A0P1IKI5_9RHOB|nr:hypothetical protein [Shimia thalassica]PHO02815.1 hypothetical protein CSC82_16775 [Rhodobacteraceae bacterium 4F10]MBU2942293.1 hypothetical protein [Shimia thalassica]MDO6481898.1 hypothetical protein [Shimia thalassica]MDO6483545.1 hypothetical protein [Shimia thalassica]MDO6505122.1 hypothetical protein [Shimia thalassica]
MFLELIAVVFAGVAAGGLMMVVRRTTGGRLPSWLVPVTAGAAMIAATISNEYTWFSRTQSELPEGMQVAQTVESRAMYRPWTYVYPYVDKFVAVDIATAKTNDAQPGLALFDLYSFGRWAAVNKIPVLGDCNLGRRAVADADVVFAQDGTISGADWVPVGIDDPILSVLCKEIG